MMGHQSPYQYKLFLKGFNLEKRIRQDHILRKILERVDFDFIYKEVQETYGINGNVSVPPPVILKMMLLLILYNVRSEREAEGQVFTFAIFGGMGSPIKRPLSRGKASLAQEKRIFL